MKQEKIDNCLLRSKIFLGLLIVGYILIMLIAVIFSNCEVFIAIALLIWAIFCLTGFFYFNNKAKKLKKIYMTTDLNYKLKYGVLNNYRIKYVFDNQKLFENYFVRSVFSAILFLVFLIYAAFQNFESSFSFILFLIIIVLCLFMGRVLFLAQINHSIKFYYKIKTKYPNCKIDHKEDFRKLGDCDLYYGLKDNVAKEISDPPFHIPKIDAENVCKYYLKNEYNFHMDDEYQISNIQIKRKCGSKGYTVENSLLFIFKNNGTTPGLKILNAFIQADLSIKNLPEFIIEGDKLIPQCFFNYLHKLSNKNVFDLYVGEHYVFIKKYLKFSQFDDDEIENNLKNIEEFKTAVINLIGI